MAFAFCSSKECDNIVQFSDRHSNAPKYCGKCGSAMLGACPVCGAAIHKKDDKFCTNCGKAYK